MPERAPDATRQVAVTLPVAAVLAAFTILAIAFTGQVWLDYAYARVPVSWGQAFAISALDWYLWALLAPPVMWIGGRVPFRRGRMARAIAVHLPASIALGSVKIAFQALLTSTVFGVSRQPTSFLKIYVTLLTYWALLGVAAFAREYAQRRERDRHAADLQTALARATLDALKMRLQPHFLFNTLNSISALMREDVEAADVMLTRLADLLRMTLDRADDQEVPLKDELDFVEKYLDIQRVRFGERLTVRVEVDPHTLPLAVPSLALQPLVENALQHGASRRTGPATVVVRTMKRDATLIVEIEDDGPGPPAVPASGHGLDTTRARLRHLHGDRASLTLAPGAMGGALARLSLPARVL
jgi:signal transduction histidine kinase